MPKGIGYPPDRGVNADNPRYQPQVSPEEQAVAQKRLESRGPVPIGKPSGGIQLYRRSDGTTYLAPVLKKKEQPREEPINELDRIAQAMALGGPLF